MDLRTVLADGTDGLGHATLAQYYQGLFARYLPASGFEGRFRVRAVLNFGVQQLAARSRSSPATEAYLQVGGLDAFDLPAALIEAMPHTRVTCLRPPLGTAEALVGLRHALPDDAMPADIQMSDADHAPAGFGLIALFPGPMGGVEYWRGLLSPGGMLVCIGPSKGGLAPSICLHA